MDVTIHSFDAAFAHLQATLPSCIFVAIDLEFTGLGSERPSHLDTPSQRYTSAKDSSLIYPPIQCGLSLFRPARAATDSNSPASVDDATWEVIPFNFQLCPRAVYRTQHAKYPIRDRVVHFQASSIDFLVTHGFDFQHCFANGISWLRKEDEESVRAELLASFSAASKREPGKPNKMYAEPSDRTVMEKLRLDVDKWLKECGAKPGSKKTLLLSQYKTSKSLLYNVIERNFPSVFVTFNLNGRSVGMPPYLRLEVMSSITEAREKMDAIRAREQNAKFERRMRDAAGFRLVIDALVASRKPLVVHHGLLDISKLLANFISPLPNTLSDFKRLLTDVFPTVWDTRVMLADAARTRPWLAALLSSEQGRTLSGLLSALSAPNRANEVPPVSIRIYNADENHDVRRVRGQWVDFGRYTSPDAGKFAHEAGFDALETGRTFLYLMGLAVGTSCRFEDVKRVETEHEILKQQVNRIYLGSCGGFLDIDLACRAKEGESEENVENARNEWLSREDVLVISGVTDEKESDLIVKRDLPHSTYYKLAEQILKAAETSFHHKSSTIMALESGSFIMIPRVKNEKKQSSSATEKILEAPTASVPEDEVEKKMTVNAKSDPIAVSQDVQQDSIVANGESEVAENLGKDRTAVAVNAATEEGAENVAMMEIHAEDDTSNANAIPNVTAYADDAAVMTMDRNRVKRDIAAVGAKVKELGLTVETYAEALLTPRPKRMRYTC